MSTFALLSKDAREILEAGRKEFLSTRKERIEAMEKDVLRSTLAGVAREISMLYPEVHYVTIYRPGNAGDQRVLEVNEVLDTDRNIVSNDFDRNRCRDIEAVLIAHKVHHCTAIESATYDFSKLADSQF